jgi:hypothetical protein
MNKETDRIYKIGDEVRELKELSYMKVMRLFYLSARLLSDRPTIVSDTWDWYNEITSKKIPKSQMLLIEKKDALEDSLVQFNKEREKNDLPVISFESYAEEFVIANSKPSQMEWFLQGFQYLAEDFLHSFNYAIAIITIPSDKLQGKLSEDAKEQAIREEEDLLGTMGHVQMADLQSKVFQFLKEEFNDNPKARWLVDQLVPQLEQQAHETIAQKTRNQSPKKVSRSKSSNSSQSKT